MMGRALTIMRVKPRKSKSPLRFRRAKLNMKYVFELEIYRYPNGSTRVGLTSRLTPSLAVLEFISLRKPHTINA